MKSPVRRETGRIVEKSHVRESLGVVKMGLIGAGIQFSGFDEISGRPGKMFVSVFDIGQIIFAEEKVSPTQLPVHFIIEGKQAGGLLQKIGSPFNISGFPGFLKQAAAPEDQKIDDSQTHKPEDEECFFHSSSPATWYSLSQSVVSGFLRRVSSSIVRLVGVKSLLP